MNIDIYAFWSYDICPFCLSGKVESLFLDGAVSVEGFGCARFNPFMILYGEKGKDAHEYVQKLHTSYENETRQLKETLVKRANKKFDEILETEKMNVVDLLKIVASSTDEKEKERIIKEFEAYCKWKPKHNNTYEGKKEKYKGALKIDRF